MIEVFWRLLIDLFIFLQQFEKWCSFGKDTFCNLVDACTTRRALRDNELRTDTAAVRFFHKTLVLIIRGKDKRI